MATSYWLAAQIRRLLLQFGYIPLTDVRRLLARIGSRLGQIDEPLSREYMLNPFPGGIEQRIHRLCRRRRVLFDKLAAAELRAEADGLVDGAHDDELE